MDAGVLEQHLSAHPLASTSLAHDDVLYGLAHLQQSKAQSATSGGNLRVAAVLLVLYVEEVLEKKQHSVLGMGKRAFFNHVRDVVSACSIITCFDCLGAEMQDLILAVAVVDTTGLTTRLLQTYLQDKHAPDVLHVPNVSMLEKIHRSVADTPEITEGETPPVSWLASTFATGVLLCAGPITVILHGAGSGLQPLFVQIAGVHLACFILWNASAKRSLGATNVTRVLVYAVIMYTLLLIVLDATLPAADIVLRANERFTRAPLVMSLTFSMLGAHFSMQVAMVLSEKWDLPSTISYALALIMRISQIVMASDEPSTQFWMCARCQIGPFIVGFITLQPSVFLTKRLWQELHQANSQTDAANVEVAMVRAHAWAVEAARREQLASSSDERAHKGNRLPLLDELRETSNALEMLRAMRRSQFDAHQIALAPGSLLVRRFIYVREFIFVTPAIMLIAARQTIVLLGFGRVTFANIAISTALGSMASLFPDQLKSGAALRYILTLVSTMAMVTLVVNLRFCYAALTVHSEDRMTMVVIVIACVGHVGNVLWNIFMYASGSYSWTHVRIHCFADGLLIGGLAVAMWAIGHSTTEPVFPPGGVPFLSACARSACTLTWPLILSPVNRYRIKAMSDATGLEPPSVLVARAMAPFTDGDANLAPSDSFFAPSGFAHSMRRVIQSHLATRLRFGRMMCVVLPAVWWVAFSADTQVPRASLPIRPSLFFAGLISFGVIIVVSTFPSELHSREGQLFLLPATLLTAVLCTIESSRSFFGYGQASHVNFGCTFAHAIHVILINANWWALFLFVARRRGTWQVVRVMLLVDGLIFCQTALLMRFLGPPPVYQPRNISFVEALERGMITPILAILLAPANRSGAAAFADKLGLKHVTVTLDEMQQFDEDEGGSEHAARVPAHERDSMSSVSRPSTHAENEVQDGNSQPRQPNPLIRQPVGAHRPERDQKSVTTQLTDDATAAVAAAPSDAVEAAHARVSAHPLTGNALSTDNVHWLALKLHLYEQHGQRSCPGDDPLRLAAVLLVLFADECLLHRRPSALGLSTDQCYALLQDLVQSSAISQNDLMDAVTTVDTEGSATHLVHSHAIGEVGLWDIKETGVASHPEDMSSPASPSAAPSPSQRAPVAWDTPLSPIALMRRMQMVHLALSVVIFVVCGFVVVDDQKQHALSLLVSCFIVSLSGTTSVAPWQLSTLKGLAPLKRIVQPYSQLCVLAVSAYLAYLLVSTCVLPSHVVAELARAQLSTHGIRYMIGYVAFGGLASMQPTATPVQRARKVATIAIVVLRDVQICAVDAQPLEILQMGFKASLLPFVLGLLFGEQQKILMRMWRENMAAKREARKTNAHVMTERERALTLEKARHVMLVARKSSGRRKGRTRTTRATLSGRSGSDNSWVVDGVNQEEGYQSPVALDADDDDDDDDERQHEKTD